MELVINFFLCIVILVFGISGYQKTKKKLPLYVGIAFGLFGISHLINMFEFATQFQAPLILIRITAYTIVLYALYDWKQKKK